MNRWRVERGFWWVAMLLDKQGREITGTAKRFTTHPEAIAYADRMARTIQVTLPRVRGRTKLTSHNGTPDGHPAGYTLIPRDKEYYSAMTIVGPWGTAGIFDAQDLEPLALALLAHARRSA